MIRYLNGDGDTVTTQAGLSVPIVSLNGEELSEEDYKEAALQVLQRARTEWNRCDHSEAERIAM